MKESELEENLLIVKDPVGGSCQISWGDGSWTGVTVAVEEREKDASFLKLARDVLTHNINLVGNQNINSFVHTLETEKSPLGFTTRKTKYTKHLINAIYYDFWQLVSRNEPVHVCENPSCKLPFKKVKRQRYCSNACKQEAYRVRKQKREWQNG